MTQYNKADLKSKIDTDFANNSTGAITAKVIRDDLNHIVDSIEPIVASGTDMYFNKALDIRDSGILSTSTPINKINSQWDNTTVSKIEFTSGIDSTNKEDGGIDFYTSGSGVTLAGQGPQKRLSIKPKGNLVIYNNGFNPPLEIAQSHAASGAAFFATGTPNILAAASGKLFKTGQLDTRTQTFVERTILDEYGHFGIGVNPEQPLHIRASGDAIRCDFEHLSNNSADLVMSKYQSGQAFNQNNLYASFGLGVDAAASGAGRFFIGFDTDRNHQVLFSEAQFVMTSGGKASVGSLYPKEQFVVGDDIGQQTSSTNDRALVIGSDGGNSKMFIGSGNATANLSNYGVSTWDKSTKQLSLETRSSSTTQPKQLVLDSTNGNVGFASSGTAPDTWRPLFNTHTYASGDVKAALESPMGSEAALYIGKNTLGSGNVTIGDWSSIGYKTGSNVLKINNSGSFIPNNLTVDRLGHIGIDTDAPYDNFVAGENKFHIYGEDSSMMIGHNASNSALRFVGSRSTNNTAYIQAGTSAADADAKLAISRFDSDSSNIYDFGVHADTTTYHGDIALNDNWLSNSLQPSGIRINKDGKVGINVASPAYELQLSSNSAGKPISSVWDVVSDSRVKTDVSTISEALDKISNLRPVKFKYTHDFCHCDEAGGVDDDTYYYNFIAQEVEVEFPEAVKSTGFNVYDHDTGNIAVSNVKTLDAHVINVYLVKAVQELKIELDAAKARITQLES
tara:strand:- start:165 stop:2369 length:2205 start_codon:yes stop_codon:yes gene_type:complete